MKRRQIVLNALTTFGQTLGSGIILFFLYRFLIRTIGLERLGIWSLVLATTSIVTLANQGFSTSIVKFVAKYAARDRGEDISLLIQTSIISITVALAIISAVLYPCARWVLQIVLSGKDLAEANAILPLALVSLWLNILEGLPQAGLAGHELIAQCNYLEMAGSVSYLLLAFSLVPGHGLIGLAYAQVIQAGVILAVTWLLLRRRVPALPVIPYIWDRALFREMASYGFHFQFITASQALREPVTKALVAKFGGLVSTSFYDMAARCVITVRELIAQANQVLVPTVASLHERDPGAIPGVYRESYRLVFFLAIPSFASLTILSPLISRLWIGHYEPVFVEFVAILSVGWVVNVLTNPAYVVDLGTGALRWVSVGCISTALINAVLGFVAGWYWGGTAVVATSAISLALGYIVVLSAYHLKNRVPFAHLLPRESGTIVLASFAGLLIFAFSQHSSPPRYFFSKSTAEETVAVLIMLILIPMWMHPMRKRLFYWISTRVPA